jgi:hypothetical protein
MRTSVQPALMQNPVNLMRTYYSDVSRSLVRLVLNLESTCSHMVQVMLNETVPPSCPKSQLSTYTLENGILTEVLSMQL